MSTSPPHETDRPAAPLCLGVITGAHGVHGRVRIKSFTADPAAIGDYGPLADESGTGVFEIRVTGETRGQVIAEIAGVRGRDAAETLKGTRLFVVRAVLPPPGEDEFYHADLIGLAAEIAGTGGSGRVVAIEDFGAGPVLEIEHDGRRTLVPFTRDAVPTVDLSGGRIVIAPLAGLFGGAGPDPGEDGAHGAAAAANTAGGGRR